MSESVLSRMISCETSSQVWSSLQTYFTSQTGAKASQYKTQLKSIKKEGMTMNDFLLKIRNVVDLLSLCDEEISLKEHVDVIFDGLPDEYKNFITNFNLRKQLESIDEVESQLLTQEARFEKKHKDNDNLSG